MFEKRGLSLFFPQYRNTQSLSSLIVNFFSAKALPPLSRGDGLRCLERRPAVVTRKGAADDGAAKTRKPPDVVHVPLVVHAPRLVPS